VFLDGHAGPYRLLVTIRPPYAIPGVAEVEVLTTESDVTEVRIVPLPLTGPGAQFAPVPDVTARSALDPNLFTGTLWMMTAGAWQVRIAVEGARGSGQLSVPVPTLPKATLEMGWGLGALLIGLLALLSAGMVAIVSAIAREAGVEPAAAIDQARRRRGRIAGAIAAVVVATVIVLGNVWWGAEASAYARYVYKPLEAAAVVDDTGRLELQLNDPGWLRSRRLDDFVPDHGHLMHLFVVSSGLDRMWHLHPQQVGTGTFGHALPDIPPGEYDLFADLVHSTGVSETATTLLESRGIAGRPLEGDDSAWTADEPSSGRIVWVRDDQPIVPKRLTLFTFRVENEQGQPAADLELYMGMPGHAVFLRRDRRVFAHVHPSGSAPMAALEIASAGSDGHGAHHAALPSTVSFPYGFPEAGDYRIFVQIKRAGRVMTQAFDLTVQ
jgi:hypothetical protein